MYRIPVNETVQNDAPRSLFIPLIHIHKQLSSDEKKKVEKWKENKENDRKKNQVENRCLSLGIILLWEASKYRENEASAFHQQQMDIVFSS